MKIHMALCAFIAMRSIDRLSLTNGARLQRDRSFERTGEWHA